MSDASAVAGCSSRCQRRRARQCFNSAGKSSPLTQVDGPQLSLQVTSEAQVIDVQNPLILHSCFSIESGGAAARLSAARIAAPEPNFVGSGTAPTHCHGKSRCLVNVRRHTRVLVELSIHPRASARWCPTLERCRCVVDAAVLCNISLPFGVL